MDDSIEALGLICECARTGCTEIVEVSIANYARARDDPTLFLVKAGHEDPDHEAVVESWGDYLLVQTTPTHTSETAAPATAPPRRGLTRAAVTDRLRGRAGDRRPRS
jgi:hypothetical protein